MNITVKQCDLCNAQNPAGKWYSFAFADKPMIGAQLYQMQSLHSSLGGPNDLEYFTRRIVDVCAICAKVPLVELHAYLSK